MLELFGTKGLELVAYLEFSNRVITEKVGESFRFPVIYRHYLFLNY